MLEAIKYTRGSLQLLDQLLLPHQHQYTPIVTCEDGWSAIRTMKVRGAPAIAISAALALAVETEAVLVDLRDDKQTHSATKRIVNASTARDWLIEKLEYLKTSRPTAVNLFEAAERLKKSAVERAAEAPNANSKEGAIFVLMGYIEEAETMMSVDVNANKKMGDYGADAIMKIFTERRATEKKEAAGEPLVSVLTHCNTGSLATAGYGTALGIIRSLYSRSKHINPDNATAHTFQAYCTETRPYNQGARLTAYELVHEKIPATLVTDSMVAALMKKHSINAVVVGADRVTANGDTANKIGTYLLAISAKHHGVPFFVAAPTTTLDPTLPDGSHIHIEERIADELTMINGQRIAANGIGVWNPAFDVTPANLITGIVTEVGVIYPNDKGVFDIPKFLKDNAIKHGLH